MAPDTYEIRQCSECGLRYPMVADHPFGEGCPSCGGKTRLVLRRELVTEPMRAPHPEPVPPLEGLLDNVRSAWNVGSMFRSADGFGVRQLHLCGITPTPEHDGVRKTALGAERSVEWTAHRDAVHLARELSAAGKRLWALEHDRRAQPLAQLLTSVSDSPGEVVLVVGNEIAGVDPELLDVCDQIIHIPMRGAKRSLNVAVAFGIALSALSAHHGARR